MTFIVTESCIKCKYTDCVEVCPVDAIKPDVNPGLEDWLELNREYASKWPNITAKKDAPADADDFKSATGKRELFSSEPGSGD